MNTADNLTTEDAIAALVQATEATHGPGVKWKRLNMLPPVGGEFEESLSVRSGAYLPITTQARLRAGTVHSDLTEWVDFVAEVAIPHYEFGALFCHDEDSPHPFFGTDAEDTKWLSPNVILTELRNGRGYDVSITILNPAD